MSVSAGSGVSQGIPGGSTTSAEEGSSWPGSPTTGGPTTSGPGTSTSAGASSGEPVGLSTSTGDSTGDGCAGACEDPAGPCELGPGACVDGQCVYPAAAAGTGCDDGDACTQDDACDGAGGCAGVEIACERPHASGGVCQDGVCQGFACVAPWADCNGDWDDGCEVPTGVANQCDANGLNPETGCWTAYCGASDDPKARNFDGFFCYHCSNCHAPAPGLWQWCSSTTGTWFASEPGQCGMFEDLVCGPP